MLHFKQQLALKYAEMVYNGLWFTPLREALDAFFTSTQSNVTGKIKLKLYKGNISVGARLAYSLYQMGLAAFSMAGYNPKDAEGFIRILGFRLGCRPAAAKAADHRTRTRQGIPEEKHRRFRGGN